MKTIWRYMRAYLGRIGGSMTLKFIGTLGELSLPYILEHILDVVVPEGRFNHVIFWGLIMIVMAFLTRQFNVWANRTAVSVSKEAIFELRHDLFKKTVHLSGARFDLFGLPSLTSRLTADSYNVQNFMTRIQTIGIRGPIMLLGGIALTLTMDWVLALILMLMVPLLLVVVVGVSIRGIPLYDRVQRRLDDVVRVMRENITGIRVVKALSREDHEMRRYKEINEKYTREDIHASTIMALPGPFMQLCLNTGLALVILVGAHRVNSGAMQPGVILAFLTYFNLILQAVMGLNRIFVMSSKASASADRIALVLSDAPDMEIMENFGEEIRKDLSPNENFIRFEDVTFNYSGLANTELDAILPGEQESHRRIHIKEDSNLYKFLHRGGTGLSEDLHQMLGEERQSALSHIDFTIAKGGSLGILGATGCGKTTVINLMMRFYDADEGRVLIDGRDVRSYDKDQLHRMFGVVFQNDVIFNDTLYNNIDFGRGLPEEAIRRAAEHAGASEFIDALPDGYQHEAAIKGANLSGGQKQRILIARALAGSPQILVLDDSSSALDYQTDAKVRAAIRENYAGVTTIMVAQRISSIMNLDHILVMEDGKMLDYGTHEELLGRCALYQEIYESQMGEMQ